MTEDYHPISCELYSKLELWIMHKERVRLVWRDPEGGDHIGLVSPCDLKTRNSVEYLYFHESDSSGIKEVRLDYIHKIGLPDSGMASG